MNAPKSEQSARPATLDATTGFALWNLGFRPFYLLASALSAMSMLLWAAAFGLFVVRYWPVLTQPRLDGKPG